MLKIINKGQKKETIISDSLYMKKNVNELIYIFVTLISILLF